jgi:hypothetical protein
VGGEPPKAAAAETTTAVALLLLPCACGKGQGVDMAKAHFLLSHYVFFFASPGDFENWAGSFGVQMCPGSSPAPPSSFVLFFSLGLLCLCLMSYIT